MRSSMSRNGAELAGAELISGMATLSFSVQTVLTEAANDARGYGPVLLSRTPTAAPLWSQCMHPVLLSLVTTMQPILLSLVRAQWPHALPCADLLPFNCARGPSFFFLISSHATARQAGPLFFCESLRVRRPQCRSLLPFLSW